MRHLLHAGLIHVIGIVLRDVGVPDASMVVEAKGFRAAHRSMPGDVVALGVFAFERHLVIDAVTTTIYRNTVLQKVDTVP